MKTRFFPLLWILLAAIVLTAAYTYFDNQRVILVEQQVVIENLPPEFEGFTILQISDLHGKRFGANQQRLLALINNTPYDLLAISGDMDSGYQPDSQPFFELLDGLENKENIFYTSGNSGPFAFDELTGALTEPGQVLQSKGVKPLNQLYTLQRGESRLIVGEFWLLDVIKIYNLGFSQQQLDQPGLSAADREYYQAALQHGQELLAQLQPIQPGDTLIGITHVPFSIDSVSEMPAIVPSYDLVLAGHYHGGQIRLPLIGAVYIPDGASERGGFFPARDEVSGLKDWGDFQQYVSRGLGASSGIPLLNFRLFNTPEINLITLTAK